MLTLGWVIMMYCWKITKYAPDHRADEWTSIYDVGKVCAGTRLTMDEYLRVEQLYLKAIDLIAGCNQVSSFQIEGMEIYQASPCTLIYENGKSIDLKTSLDLARHILREEQWCRLVNPRMFVHFGYDYHMYIGSADPAAHERQKIRELGLYCEEKESPYDVG